MNKNTIIRGDCREVLARMPDKFIDLIVSSPPYWDFVNYTDNDTSDIGKNQSLDDYCKQMADVFHECYRVLEDGRYMCIVIRDMTKNRVTYPLHCYMIKLAELEGFVLEEIKYILLLAHAHYDYALVFRKGEPRFSAVMKDKYDEPFWDLRKYAEKNKHPASFISMIPRILIDKYSKEGETVLDSFMGSGTVCSVSQDMNRLYIGVEISKEFYDMAVERLKKRRKTLKDY